MSADEPEQRSCPKVPERQIDGSSEMKITAAPEADDGPCAVCGTKKDSKSEPCAGDSNTTHKHAVPWPHVELWRKNVALAGIFLGIFFSTLDTTIIATSLISIVEDLGDFTMSPWIILSYLLTYMSFAMAFARFSDIYGRKPLMLIAWTLFMTFSLGCALSRTLLQLIVFRAFQGLGGAGLYSMGMVMMAEILKPSQMGVGSALVGVTVGGSGVLGPVLGGAISHETTWRWIFYMNLIPGALVMASIFFIWPRTVGLSASAWQTFVRIDFVGVVLMLGASICMIYGFQGATTGGHTWSYPPVIACHVLAPTFLVFFIVWELFISKGKRSNIEPIFPIRILKHRVMASAFASILLTGFPQVTAVITLPERFQLVNGASSLHAGLSLLPLGGAIGFGSFLGGALSSKRNLTSPTLIAGSALQLLGLGLLSITDSSFSSPPSSIPRAQYGFQTILGLGIGMCLSSGTIMVTLNSARGQLGATQGATAMLRPLGGFMGLTITTALFNARCDKAFGRFLEPGELAALHRSPVAALGFAPGVLGLVRMVYERVFGAQMRVLMYIAVLGLVAACCSWERRPVGVEMTRVHLGIEEDGGVVEGEGDGEREREGKVEKDAEKEEERGVRKDETKEVV